MKNKGFSRRSFIVGTLGFLGGVAATTSLSRSLQKVTAFWLKVLNEPSTLTNVEVDVSQLAYGESMATTWKNRTIYIVRRDQQVIDLIDTNPEHFYDYDSENYPLAEGLTIDPTLRSINREYLVVDGHCTHLGCSLTPVRIEENPELPNGGFICGCHKGKFDLTGRVHRNTPPPMNLVVPPHHFKDDKVIVIGKV
ncbi:ubiquinol-cytochrome c reductase iron-sulfur subunit [Vibrio sp. DW001]|uniref:ubiquinol-cytochrome c reductase iron-sulfur subunit n=1 Tax=Vibrio sp. DW001 TaxID=2912315 RepID=UPI0023AE92F9|nr:ubiquinol-cytochrome c reductase iron-sulfur subunit [Vibrio sp. DW001]WED29592.1 ubiquinol-cytochrome c reductase iron-sulfur subunit [Vibrio sp. DW001]